MNKYILINDDKDLLFYIQNGVKGFIFGDDRFNAIGINKINFNKMIDMLHICKDSNIKVILYFNALITQDRLKQAQDIFNWCIDNKDLYEYIAVSDYCFMEFNSKSDTKLPLIYAPDTLVTSSMDANTFLSLGYKKVWLANELSINEIQTILDSTNNSGLIQVFGYLKTSNSRRYLITNYLDYINKEYDYKYKDSLTLVEETRQYHMPIIENDNGTVIFADFLLYDRDRFSQLDNAYGLVYSSLFIDSKDVLKAYKGLDIDSNKYHIDSTYWESETTIKKENNNE